MPRVSVQKLIKGDVIIEHSYGKPRMTPVTKVEFNACSSHGVHVNRNSCYDFNAVVDIAEAEGNLADLEKEIELGVVRVSEDGVNEEDLDAVMDKIEAWADLVIQH
jgi:hypothetical protein